ncbi:MAG: muconolactone Delta-isomerase family protein [Planctomycetota bacterium]|jgi:hypothetical protein
MLYLRSTKSIFKFIVISCLFLSLTAVQAQEQNLYMVSGTFIDPGPMLQPQQMAPIIEKLIIPSLEIIAKWEEEGKVLGGGLPLGDRAGLIIIKASSNTEVDNLLQGLPFWGLLKWEVTPLVSYKERIIQARKTLEELKKMAQ